MAYNRGEVYYVDTGRPSIGHEQWTGRPAVIVSNTENNSRSGTVEVVYLTTQPKQDLPTHVKLNCTGKTSTALCEQVQTVDVSRLMTYCAERSRNEMQAIDIALMISLGLDLSGTSRGQDGGHEGVMMNPDLSGEVESLKAEVAAANAQRDMYKQIYENLLQMVVKKGTAV